MRFIIYSVQIDLCISQLINYSLKYQIFTPSFIRFTKGPELDVNKSVPIVVMEERYLVLVAPCGETDVWAVGFENDAVSTDAVEMPFLLNRRNFVSATECQGRIFVCGGEYAEAPVEAFTSENDRFLGDMRAFAGWSPRGQWTSIRPSTDRHFKRPLISNYNGKICMISSKLLWFTGQNFN